MKVLLLLLLSPLAFATKAPENCAELSGIVRKLELELMSKYPTGTSEGCSTLSAEALKVQPFSEKQGQLLKGFQCSDLSNIEAEIARKETELTVLGGFEKLKTDIQVQQAASNPDLANAPAAGKEFTESLITAQSFEALLGTKIGNDDLLIRLRSVPAADRASVSSFTRHVRALCNTRTEENEASPIDACAPGAFNPSEAAVSEINSILVDEIKSENVAEWAEALAIKKVNATEEDSAYSFFTMRKDLEGALKKIQDKDPNLSKAELKVIASLTEFENKQGFSFLENLKGIKNATAPRVQREKFKFLLTDLKQRQQFEIQSRLSQAWYQKKSSLTDDAEGSCAGSAGNFSMATKCISHLQASVRNNPSSENVFLKHLLETLEKSQTYQEKLDEKIEKCVDIKSTGPLSEDCLRSINGDQAELQSDLVVLHALRRKIREENQSKFTFRNFAIEKFQDQCGGSSIDTPVGDCDKEYAPFIAPEATALLGEGLDIMLVYAKPKSENKTELEASCEEETMKLEDNQRDPAHISLCAYLEEGREPVNVTAPTPVPAEDLRTAQAPDGYGPVASALRNAVSSFMNQTMRPQVPTNPFAYSPIPSRCASLSTCIVANSGAYVPGGPPVGTYFRRPDLGFTPTRGSGISPNSFFPR